jgi:4-diphosphocytidyl-2-C-methyl-D-erythritol kinase
VTGTLPAVLTAPAKLTRSLRVIGVRDDGLHLIDAEMVTLDLADTLVLAPDSTPLGVESEARTGPGWTRVTFTGPHAAGLEPGDDLVTRALALVGATARVEVDKQIPSGAGLGGGSADAAAILRWAGFQDVEAQAGLGADVPFCVRGGRARVTGIGERIEPLPYEDRTFTLLTPPVHCATAAVYRAWDDLGGPAGPNGNDLEPAALAMAPDLARWRDELHEATGAVPMLAGSGSTWFVEGDFPGVGRRVVHTTRG